jgi:hypothetical protein
MRSTRGGATDAGGVPTELSLRRLCLSIPCFCGSHDVVLGVVGDAHSGHARSCLLVHTARAGGVDPPHAQPLACQNGAMVDAIAAEGLTRRYDTRRRIEGVGFDRVPRFTTGLQRRSSSVE